MACKKSMDGDEERRIASTVWDFLDKLAASKPDEYKKFVDQQVEEGRQLLTPPQPVYCLHCPQVRAWENTCSLYINVCKWTRVPKPKTSEDPIPVKAGVLRYLIDERTKLKTPSKDLVFDAAFNPSVMDECTRDPMLDNMMVALLLEYVEKMSDLIVLNKETCRKIEEQFKGPKGDLQYSLDEHWGHLLTPESRLDVGYSILKQLHGLKTDESDDNKKDLPPLIFRGNETTTTTSSQATSIGPTQQKKRLIEEISAEQAAVHAASHSKNERLQCTTPVHSVAVKEPDSKHPKQRVFVKVTLPGVSSANQVDLEVSKNDLQLSVKQQYHLSLQLPTPVDSDATKAKFTSKNSVLTISMPCL